MTHGGRPVDADPARQPAVDAAVPVGRRSAGAAAHDAAALTSTGPLPDEDPAPEPSALRRQARDGIVWAAAEKWMVRLSTLVGFWLLSRLLQPEQFGIVALAAVFTGLLTVVTDGGISVYLVQRRTLDRVVTSTAFYLSAAMGLVLGPALALSAPLLAGALDTPALREVLPALAIALVIASLSNVPASLLNREMRFRELAMRQVLATGLSVVVAVALALAGAGVWALVAQTLVRAGVAFVVLWATSDFRPALAFSPHEARAMASYGTKTLGVELMRQARIQGEALVIGALLGTVALGIWVVALRIVDVITDLCASVFSRVAGPVFARLRDDPARLGRALGTSMGMGALVVVPLLVALALTSDVVVPFVFGEQWVPAAGVAAVLAFRSIATALSDFQRAVLVLTGRVGTELALSAVQFVGQTVLLLVLAERGLVVLAVALAAWAVLSWPLRTIVLRQAVGIRWGVYRPVALVLLAAGLAAAAALLTDRWLTLDGLGWVTVAVLGGGIVYGGAVLMTCRPLAGEALASLPGPLGRRARQARSRRPYG